MAGITKDREDAEKQRDANKKKIVDLATKEKEKGDEREGLQGRILAANKDKEVASGERAKIARVIREVMAGKGDIESEINALKAKYKSEVDALEKVEPVFQTLKKLRQLIKQRGVQGYKGLLIEYLDFDPKFSACVDLAANAKLFSIIVEDLEAAKQILQINSEIKGGVIQIYPLSIIHQVKEEKQRNYPNRADVRPLHTLVKLKVDADNRLAKLAHNLFSKVLLVKDYSVAMSVAKEWNLTCITADLQIVHAGAFITQVGSYNRSQADRVTLYRKVSQIEHEVEAKVLNSLHFDRLKDQETERELECLRKIQRADVTVNSLKSAYQQLSSIMFELKAQHD